MIPFFFIGSRRSGTTLACHMINFHPKLYTPFERYIMWILRCIRESGTIKAPPCGALAPMLITFSQSDDAFLQYIRSNLGDEATRTAFFSAMHNCRMKRGTGKWRDDLVAIGEKNPPEYAHPDMQEFLLRILPEARFIHLVRHPAAVCGSQVRYMRVNGGNNFLTRPEEWKSELSVHYMRWVGIEKWVLDAKQHVPVLTIRYEDLCADPVCEVHKIYDFFGLGSTDYIDRRIVHRVKKGANTKYPMVAPSDAGDLFELMKMYDYQVDENE